MTTKTISGAYANGYTLAAKYDGLRITSTGSATSSAGAGAGYYSGVGAAAGLALSLPHGGVLTNAGQVRGGQGGYGGNASRYDIGVDGGAGGAGGGGVVLSAAGAITNSGGITAGAGGVGGYGSPGYFYSYGGVGPGGNGGRGGDGGAGIVLSAGGSLTNFATIAGGVGGNGGGAGNQYAFYGFGGAGGAGVVLSAPANVTNFGTISGGAGGLGGQDGINPNAGYAATGGSGVVASAGGNVVNGSASEHSALIVGDVGVMLAGTGTVINFGTIQGTTGDSVSLGSSVDRLIAEAGSNFVGPINGGGGTLELAGGVDTISGLGATTTLSGSISAIFSGFNAYVVDRGAAVTLTGTDSLAKGQTLVDYGLLEAAASGVIANAGQITLADSAVFKLAGTVSDSGLIYLNGGNVLIAAGGATITGSGELVLHLADVIEGVTSSATLTNASRILGIGQIGEGQMRLVNQTGAVIESSGGGSLTINTGASTIINAGIIEAAGPVGGITIASAVNNSGDLIAASAKLTLNGAVSGNGIGVIVGSGVLDATSSFNERVTFAAGSTGTLELAHSLSYTNGAIIGLSTTGANALDLADIVFIQGTTKATFAGTSAGGILTVTDGSHAAHIHLVGNYLGHTFNTSLGSGGVGTKVVDPPAAFGPNTGAFVSAMATLGAETAPSSAWFHDPRHLVRPMVALPRAS